jgi:hypothetical protein
MTPEERFAHQARAVRDDEYCLHAPRLLTVDGLTRSRHRELWLRVIGPLGKKRLVRRDDAPCALDVFMGGTWCANPYHFEAIAGTRKRRGRAPYQSNGLPTAAEKNRAKTHCPKNHPLTPENVYLWTDSKGRQHRTCRRCKIRSSEKQRSKR